TTHHLARCRARHYDVRASYRFLSPARRPLRAVLFPYTTLFRSLNLVILTDSQGNNGGGWPHYVGQEKVRPIEGWNNLAFARDWRSEEHTSELQSRFDLVCRLLLEKKKRRRCCDADGR